MLAHCVRCTPQLEESGVREERPVPRSDVSLEQLACLLQTRAYTVLTEQHVSQVERAGQGQWSGRSSKFTAAGAPDSNPRCSRGGYTEHLQDQCPYKLRGWICRACNTAGHNASMCLAKRKQPARNERQQKHLDAYDEPNDTFETVKGVLTGSCSESASEFDLNVRVNGVPLRMELDTGAEASVAPRNVWLQLGRPKLQAAPRLRAYGGTCLPSLGQAEVNVEFRGQHKRL